MTGIPGSLFLPLAMAIAFSMITSYFLAQTFVPIMANWLMKSHHHQSAKDGHILTDEEEYAALGITAAEEQDTWDQKKKLLEKQSGDGKVTRFDKFRNRFLRFLDRIFPYQKPVVILYTLLTCGLLVVLFMQIGRDVLPKVNSGQFQVRLRAPDGTRLERTEEKTIEALKILEDLVGKNNISVSSAFIGQHPGQFSTSPIYLFMSGPQEAVLQVALKETYKEKLDDLKERLRRKMKEAMPDIRISFEPIELTDKVLSQGSPTPIEVRIMGKDKKLNEQYANKVIEKLNQIDYLRDVQLAQPIKYPTLDIEIDRTRAAQMGVTLSDISRSLVAATSSSRYTEKNVWIDPRSNISYGVQVQIPENQMTSMNDINEIPVLSNETRPLLGDVARVTQDTSYGENDNLGALPFLSVTANLNNKDLGTATKDVSAAILSMGVLPRGLSVETKGLTEVLSETLSSLQVGLITAVAVIFLMLAANFQSFKVSLVVLSTLPAVLLGSLAMLLFTGSTLNLQSYMGIIMSVGVSIANSVLLITNAEHLRRHTGNAMLSAKESAALRMRPILMTSVAMVVGMLPMASGFGDGGDQAAPLGRAVVGGLIASTFAALFILPLVFTWVQGKASTASVSLDPEDKESAHYIPELKAAHKSN
jgi:multidrug efflux pump subunit AcrB